MTERMEECTVTVQLGTEDLVRRIIERAGTAAARRHSFLAERAIGNRSYMEILEMIPAGRMNAVKARDIQEKLECSERALRRVISKLRRIELPGGWMLCSSCGAPPGYWLTNDPEEIEQYVCEKRKQGIGTMASVSIANRVAKRSPGQERWEV